MGTIAGLLGAFLARIFSVSVLRWLALKSVLTALFVVVLPVILNNFLYEILNLSFNFLDSIFNNISTINVNFTGLASYILQEIYFTEWFSIIVSAIIYKFTIRLIPFIKV